jgi:hypothetical protein
MEPQKPSWLVSDNHAIDRSLSRNHRKEHTTVAEEAWLGCGSRAVMLKANSGSRDSESMYSW